MRTLSSPVTGLPLRVTARCERSPTGSDLVGTRWDHAL